MFSSVQSLIHVQLFAIPWTAARQASLSITSSQSLLKLMSIKSVMPSNHVILCRPLLLPPSVSPSIRVFSNESVLHIRWPKYWHFSFIISPSNGYSGLISFRMDWLDLLAVQGTLKSLQHHSSKASILCLLKRTYLELVHLLDGSLSMAKRGILVVLPAYLFYMYLFWTYMYIFLSSGTTFLSLRFLSLFLARLHHFWDLSSLTRG